MRDLGARGGPEQAAWRGMSVFHVIAGAIVTCALFAVALIAVDAYLERPGGDAGRAVAAQTRGLGPLLNAASEGFLNFECTTPSADCGTGAAERYCRDRGQSLVRWRAEPVAVPSAPTYRFSMAEIICRSM